MAHARMIERERGQKAYEWDKERLRGEWKGGTRNRFTISQIQSVPEYAVKWIDWWWCLSDSSDESSWDSLCWDCLPAAAVIFLSLRHFESCLWQITNKRRETKCPSKRINSLFFLLIYRKIICGRSRIVRTL